MLRMYRGIMSSSFFGGESSILEREDNQRIEQTTGANRLFVCYSCFNKPSAAATRAGRAGTIRTFSGNNIDSQ